MLQTQIESVFIAATVEILSLNKFDSKGLILESDPRQGKLAKPTEPTDGGGETQTKSAVFKELIDAYGAGVRAGTITPTLEDENMFRQLAELPAATADVVALWKEDGGVRRPVTLKYDEQPAADPAASADGGDGSQE